MARILAISGSPSHPSRTYSLIEHAIGLLPSGIEAEVIAVRDLPPEVLVFARFDSPALDGPKALLEQADGLIVATPIYKAAYTGLLKSFLDLLPQKALLGKAVLPIATGGTLAHLLAIDYALKPVLSELGAGHLLKGVYAVDKQIQRQADGSTVLDEEIDQRLRQSVVDLLKAIGG
ncbi:NADPH-dependent FMN reductase [Gloeobacter morelensis]|uniref:NADPH-dependent FMN reductase n=1 Tax=Gloeobacter morelensis MG652769 TaxID=2781736 RepID=A0ABY3PNQ6_9CYAN|nr:NADPH-dependent FMN reductase [Gloeobacter morelensis]UFP95327.1 NADPH-dependent FMN reductase [Gloeobacter morelensis MG652769]